jgi:hypothetical protein
MSCHEYWLIDYLIFTESESVGIHMRKMNPHVNTCIFWLRILVKNCQPCWIVGTYCWIPKLQREEAILKQSGMQHEMRVIRIVCSKHQFDFSYIVTSITGSSAMDSEESRAFSTSSRTVVYKLFPGCCTQQWNQNKTVLSQACTVWTKQELKLILINCRKKLISMQDTKWFFWAPQGSARS